MTTWTRYGSIVYRYRDGTCSWYNKCLKRWVGITSDKINGEIPITLEDAAKALGEEALRMVGELPAPLPPPPPIDVAAIVSRTAAAAVVDPGFHYGSTTHARHTWLVKFANRVLDAAANEVFCPCAACAANPTDLCPSCLANRAAITHLAKRADDYKNLLGRAIADMIPPVTGKLSDAEARNRLRSLGANAP